MLTELQAKAQREHLLGSAATVTNEAEIAELLSAWQAYNSGRVRPRTWQSYAFCLHDVLSWLDAYSRPRCVRDLRLADVEAYKAAALASGLSARSVAMRVGALNQLLMWALREGRIASDPLAGWRPPRGERRINRRALTEFEIAKLLESSPEELGDIWRALLGTGLRAGELVSLEWDDIDFASRRLRVRAEVSKSKRTRWVAFGGMVGTILSELALRVAERPRTETARRLVFVSPRGAAWGNRLSRLLKPCLEKAGLAPTVDLHTLRHTCASHLIRRAADVKTVQALLGHSPARVTLDIYAHEWGDSATQAVEAIESLVASKARRKRAECT